MDRATARKIPTSNKKSPQTCAVAVWGLCAVYGWLTILPMVARWYVFVASRRCTPPGNILLRSTKCSQLKCCARRVLHGQRVWDAAQQVLARQGALYIQRHCLQVQGPLQEHTTFRESLVCYTSPPGGVDSSGFVRGPRLGRCSGWRSK